jgi:hypothetical protein
MSSSPEAGHVRLKPSPPSCQLIQQRFRVPQVGRIETFGKPTVDRTEQNTGFLALALVAPEASEHERGLYLEELGFLTTPSVPMMMRHLPPGSLDPKARKDFLIHAHAAHTE